MAVYSQLSAGDISSIDDMQKVRDYLYKLNKNLKYMFNNLTPEDNYSELARLTLVTDGERQASIETALEGINLNYVSKDGIVSAINLSEETAQIKANKIQLEGVVTVNGYFKVGLDGSIEARNGKFSGSISGSDISLGGLGGGDGYIVVYNSNGTEIGRWSKDGINVGAGSIQGANITLGGVNNVNGTLTIKGANATTIGSWTKDGIDVGSGSIHGAGISIGGVSGGDGYIVVYNSSGAEIGRWSKDGINVGAGSIHGANISLGGANGGNGYIVVYNSSGAEIGRWSKDGINVGSGSIQGANITLGGVNNINGTLTIKDADGATIGSWTKDGITATGGTFSGNISASTITGSTIDGGHIYGAYYGSRTSNNFFIIAEDDVTVVGVPGFEFKNKKMASNWIGSVENPALGNSDQAGINGNTGDAGFRKLYLLDDWYEGQDGTFWDVTRTLRWLDNRITYLEENQGGGGGGDSDGSSCEGGDDGSSCEIPLPDGSHCEIIDDSTSCSGDDDGSSCGGDGSSCESSGGDGNCCGGQDGPGC